MVRNYKKKTQRCSYGTKKLQEALSKLDGTNSLKSVAKTYGIPTRTLRRHRDGFIKTPGIPGQGRKQCVPEEIEKLIADRIKEMNSRLFGLTVADLRKFVFDCLTQENVDHPFTNGSAGKDWLSSFMKRHDMSLRISQATSIARMVGFNKPKVEQFFSKYKELLSSRQIQPTNLYNMDETGITTVQKVGKVVATKGSRNVAKATSAERGQLVTVVCAMSASGTFIPPMYIFPRKIMRESLMKGAPPGSVGCVSDSGWTNDEIFLKWLEHFAKNAHCSAKNQCVLLLDGHNSHKSLAAVNFCRENGIDMMTFPPHSTHKMQPLDKVYFKPYKTAYNKNCDSWMVSNPGKRLTIHDLAEVSCTAFLNTAKAATAVNGFRTCGLWPYNPDIFTDEDFQPSNVTEEDLEQLSSITQSPVDLQEEVDRPSQDPSPSEITSGLKSVQPSTSRESLTQETISPTEEESVISTEKVDIVKSFKEAIKKFSPLPKAATKRSRSRTSEVARILTSTPEKNAIEEKTKVTRAKVIKQTKTKSAKKLKFAGPSTSQYDCMICGEPESNSAAGEEWIRCASCDEWAHMLCTSGEPVYVCHECLPE